MKKFFLILTLCFFCIPVIGQSCLPEGIKFKTQNQIDSFTINYPDCTEIEGDLTIQDAPVSKIYNLNALHVLTRIGGDLCIKYCPSLFNLSGLEGLTSVGGDLWLFNNINLYNLKGLKGLRKIQGNLFIWNNYVLNSLLGLDNLTLIEGGISIKQNYYLDNLNGLESLGSLASITIDRNPALTNIQ